MLRRNLTPALLNFCTETNQEVDVVLKDVAGRLVVVGVKASGSVGRHDFRHLAMLAELAGERLRRGVVLYT
ncbi:MAG: ATP-binding protein, partial [Gemmatimonadota bacterium]|nr:ATP-binding protein [Gemmatimonadota bacterium]